MVSTDKFCRSLRIISKKHRNTFFLGNVFFSNVQINKWLHLSSSVWKISVWNFFSLQCVQKKYGPENFPVKIP